MSIKDSIRSLVAKLGLSQSMWSGDYKDWGSALQKSDGYTSLEILEKVKKAVLKVKSGEAVYERDSVLFDKIEYSWPLLASLMWVAAKNKGSLKVLDFGGSLGSSYFQNKRFLDQLSYVEWNIVEQKNYVASGKEYVQNNILQFFESISECTNVKGLPDIIIFSCVIPYLEKPYSLLDEVLHFDIPHIVIDNTPFNYKKRDRITIQKIPPTIFDASIPCWFLSYDNVKSKLLDKYCIANEFYNDSIVYLDGHSIQYQGILAELKY